MSSALRPVHAAEIITAELDRMGADPSAPEVELRLRCAAVSRAEARVLDQLVLGLSNQEIAHALGHSVQTVKNALRFSYEKLGVNSRVQAALLWRDYRAIAGA